MATVVELFNEDRLVHPQIPHAFAVPRLMTHLWRKALSKDADVLFTVHVGAPFWPTPMHEPLIVLIVLPLSYDSMHRGPWTLRGSSQAIDLTNKLEAGFKEPSIHGCQKFHDLEGPMHGMQDFQAKWSRTLLFKFLAATRSFPPVSSCMVRGVLHCSPQRPISGANSLGRRRKRRPGNRGEAGQTVQGSKRRRSLDGSPF